MTIVVKKVPKCLRGIVKLLFGIKEKEYINICMEDDCKINTVIFFRKQKKDY